MRWTKIMSKLPCLSPSQISAIGVAPTRIVCQRVINIVNAAPIENGRHHLPPAARVDARGVKVDCGGELWENRRGWNFSVIAPGSFGCQTAEDVGLVGKRAPDVQNKSQCVALSGHRLVLHRHAVQPSGSGTNIAHAVPGGSTPKGASTDE